jgi:hypothetical protein
LPTYDISMYVSLIGLKLVNSASSVKNRLPKTAFEILLVVVVLLTASCSSPPTAKLLLSPMLGTLLFLQMDCKSALVEQIKRRRKRVSCVYVIEQTVSLLLLLCYRCSSSCFFFLTNRSPLSMRQASSWRLLTSTSG